MEDDDKENGADKLFNEEIMNAFSSKLVLIVEVDLHLRAQSSFKIVGDDICVEPERFVWDILRFGLCEVRKDGEVCNLTIALRSIDTIPHGVEENVDFIILQQLVEAVDSNDF